ncbi:MULTISPECIES: thioredoxin family protein [Bacillaceae]|uniref:thioredoxin family protein n=1 Tax=Bacillaceae TaxID=186817 RepID=UPI001C55F308|nr:thioredoxin family protein [Rossellomorea sp. YZS02]MBW3112969.1 thioredoxin family protein [Bacillus sp. MCCB 382]MDX8345059.1 thioredoxin family protein [Rossellomorea sp. YZS02]
MNLEQWFEKGMTSSEYIDNMNVHKENTETIRKGFRIPVEDVEVLNQLGGHSLRVLVITEDWCGDAMLNIPILLNVAEAANLEVRMILRDENLELMDQYLTNGTSRAIPIFIFIDQEGNEKLVWGPRAPMVKKIVDDERAKLPPKDHELFPEKQKEMIQRLTSQYCKDRGVWQEVYDSLKTSLVQNVLM